MNKEIFWNLINSLLAGALVFLGAFSNGTITPQAVIAAISAAGIAAIIQFRLFINHEIDECVKTPIKLFKFV